MEIMKELATNYRQLSDYIDSLELNSDNDNELELADIVLMKQKLNDMAYFLFSFTRLEDRIRELSNKLITEKIAALLDWEIRAAWEIIQKQSDNDSLHFMNRVALLTKKGETDYNLIKRYYDQRNTIGHGGEFTISINVSFVFEDMIRLYNQFDRGYET